MIVDRPESYERLLVKAPLQFRRETARFSDPHGADYVVRVDVCGLCRSDLHAVADWATEWQEVGHEFGGTVVLGPRSGRFAVGDRVAVRTASPCGQCSRCRGGATRGCERLVVNTQGFRDYALCDERSLVDATGLDDDALALVEPTNVALDLLQAAQIDPSHTVTVLGAGTLGVLTAFLAREVSGAAQVCVLGRQPTSPVAAAVGVTHYVPFSSRRIPAGPADRVLVTTPPSTLESALSLCRPGGWVITAGLDDTERCRISRDIGRLSVGQRVVKGVCAAPNAHFDQAVCLLRQHGASLRLLIGRRIPRKSLEFTLRAWHSRLHFEGKTIVLAYGGIQ
jgi:threonine dehydrogenase-like Zn-dependent dehydrogenase